MEFLQTTFDENKVRQMLLAENQRNQNLLHMVARHNLPLQRNFHELKRSLDPTTFIAFLKSVDCFGNNVFCTIFIYEHYKMLEEFINFYKTELDSETLKSLLTAQNTRKENIIHTAVRNATNVDAIMYLLSQLALILDHREILNMILASNNNGFTIVDREEIVSYLNREVLKLSTNVKLEMHKQMVLHVIIQTADAETLEHYLEFMKNSVKATVTNEACFRAKTKDGDNIIHSAIHAKDIVLMAKLLYHLFDQHKLDTAIEMFLEQNNNGTNVVGLAVEIGNADVIQLFFSSLLDHFSGEVRARILLAKNRHGENVFHFILQKCDQSLFTTALKLLDNDLKQTAIKEALLSTTNYGCNVLHIAIAKSDIPCVELILTLCAYTVSKMLSFTTKNGENVLHVAAQNANSDMLKHVAVTLKHKLSFVTCKTMYQATTNYGSNVFHILAVKNKKESFLFYIDLLTKDLGLDIVKTMLLMKNHLGNDIRSIHDSVKESQLADVLKQILP
jgi:hypothetical protein